MRQLCIDPRPCHPKSCLVPQALPAYPGQVMMELAYLKSYTDMGQASVVCAWGCRCADTLLEGHHNDKTSQVRRGHGEKTHQWRW